VIIKAIIIIFYTYDIKDFDMIKAVEAELSEFGLRDSLGDGSVSPFFTGG